MKIDHLLYQVRQSSGFSVATSTGVPLLPAHLSLPEDVARFYSLCGGVMLFEDQSCPIGVSGPDELDPANLAILGVGPQGDPSDDWYVIARSGSDQFISIDLSKSKNGRCYDSYWDRHGIVGSCPIIARSFTEFLERSIASAGRELYWLRSSFSPLGDAYSDS